MPKLSLHPETIIRLYSYRFKIECTFRELKQVIGGFHYHFWSKSMPKLNRFFKKGDKNPLEDMKENDKKLIIDTLKAIENYVMCSAIAIGLLQIIAILFSTEINKSPFRFLRIKSNDIVSEATVACIIRKKIFLSIQKNKNLGINKIIREKQREHEFYDDLKVS